jgi:prophage regulatory protein
MRLVPPPVWREILTRTVIRKPAVLAATGWSNSTLYDKMKAGKFPKPTRLDPEGRIVVWLEDEVEAFQKQAIERAAATNGEAAA